MRLLIDASTLEGGGITHLSNILLYGKFQEYEEVVLIAREKYKDKLKIHKNMIFYESDNMNLILLYGLKIHKIAAQHNVDCVLATNGLYIGTKKTIIICHNFLPFDMRTAYEYYPIKSILKNILLRFVYSISYRSSNIVIFLSDFVLKKVTQMIKIKRSIILPHGIENVSIYINKQKLKSKIGVHKFVYTSSFEPYKNHKILFQACKILKDKGYNFHIDLIGSGTKIQRSSIIQLIDYFELKDIVNLIGNLTQNELFDRYQSYDTGLFLSSCENLPNILIEYLALGLPVLSTDIGPMNSIMGVNDAWKVSADDTDELSHKMEKRLNNNLPVFDFNYDFFKCYYSWKRVAFEIDANLFKVLNE
jgi:glycosyltransferase involved in cell wall biosynthesis